MGVSARHILGHYFSVSLSWLRWMSVTKEDQYAVPVLYTSSDNEAKSGESLPQKIYFKLILG